MKIVARQHSKLKKEELVTIPARFPEMRRRQRKERKGRNVNRRKGRECGEGRDSPSRGGVDRD
jgi:nucleoid DNA-binding protein